MRTRLTPARVALLAAAALLPGCDDDVSVLIPHGETRTLGVIELTFAGIGKPRPVVSVTTVAGSGIQLEPVAARDLLFGSTAGVRYLSAMFRVRNATADGVAYDNELSNLTFLGISAAGALEQTAVRRVRLSDGRSGTSLFALQVAPAGMGTVNEDGGLTADHPDVLQLFAESDLAAFGQTAISGTRLPYGFVTRRVGSDRTRVLPASPAPDQFDGIVTIAFRMPARDTDGAELESLTVTLLVADDKRNRQTQSLEEHESRASTRAEERARGLAVRELTLLPRGDASIGNGRERVLCSVRTAGTAGSPLARLLPAQDQETWSVPSAYRAGPRFIGPAVRLAVGRCPAIEEANENTFSIHGRQSGHVTGTYSGAGSPIAHAPAPDGGFHAGEEIEVTLTTALGGSRPFVGRYTVQTTLPTGGNAAHAGSSPVQLETRPSALALADFDGNGRLEIVVAHADSAALRVLEHDGVSALASRRLPISAPLTALLAADLFRSGRPHLAGSSRSGIAVLQNDGAGRLVAPRDFAATGTPASLAYGDFNGDARIDIAGADSTGAVLLALNQSAGAFVRTAGVQLGAGAIGSQSLASLDFNNDGRIDLAFVNQAGTLWLLANNGAANLAVTAQLRLEPGAFALTDADFDGDGDADLAVANPEAGTVAIFTNNGTGAFSRFGTIAVAGGPQLITAADLDGDGSFDLATVGTDGTVSVLVNDGSARFRLAATVSLDDVPVALEAGDVDGDGSIDLVIATRQNSLSILINR